MENEFTRIKKVVGSDGKLRERCVPGPAAGSWATGINSVNQLIDNLVQPVSEMGLVIGAVAKGDLTQTMSYEIEGSALKGAFLQTAKTINTMVDQLSTFSGEVIRVASEVGGKGKLGAQAEVPGVSGSWKDLTDNVNMLANNLTEQVRNIAQVTTAVAQGGPDPEDHGGGQWRDLGIKGYHQYHGGPAFYIRQRSDPCGDGGGR